MEEQTKSLSDYLAAFQRRKLQIATVFGILMLIVLAVAFLLSPVYRSTATILIEEQEVPPELVQSTITSYADQRIQVISQQVMTRQNLLDIVNKYNLYPEVRERETTEDVLDRMRDDISLNIISADVVDPRRGVPTKATIAFTLSYNGDNPAATQRVASELVSLYLNENLKNRQEKTQETRVFLSEEAERLSAYISKLLVKIAAFKEQNVGRLPELMQLNIQMRDRADSELMGVDQELRALEERKAYLDGQLAQIKPNTPLISSSGERILDTTERLKTLQAAYTSLSGVYTADHPDLKKMQREIAALESEGGQNSDSAEHAKQLTRLRAELAMTSEKYSPSHPDVVRLKREIKALESLESLSRGPRLEDEKPENPAYITLQAQLEAVNSDMRSLKARRSDLEAKIASYEERLEQTPQVEREYLDLSRDYENARMRYLEINEKQMQAQVAEELEKDRKGERFSLIDPPQLPEKPESPNRPAIILLGFVMALGGGMAYAGVLESMDNALHGARSLSAVLGAPPLAVIPYVQNRQDRGRQQRIKVLSLLAVILVVLATLAAIHFLVTPLDVFWFRLMRKLELD